MLRWLRVRRPDTGWRGPADRQQVSSAARSARFERHRFFLRICGQVCFRRAVSEAGPLRENGGTIPSLAKWRNQKELDFDHRRWWTLQTLLRLIVCRYHISHGDTPQSTRQHSAEEGNKGQREIRAEQRGRTNWEEQKNRILTGADWGGAAVICLS